MNLTQIGFEDMDWFYLAKRPVEQIHSCPTAGIVFPDQQDDPTFQR